MRRSSIGDSDRDSPLDGTHLVAVDVKSPYNVGLEIFVRTWAYLLSDNHGSPSPWPNAGGHVDEFSPSAPAAQGRDLLDHIPGENRGSNKHIMLFQ